MPELSMVVGDLKNAAQLLNAAAENLATFFSTCQPGAETGKQSKAEKQPAPAKPPPPPAITLEQLRAVLAEKSREGKPVKDLLAKHGAGKLSDVPPDKYAEIMSEAEAL
jgi:hypothetical protein